MDRDIAHADWPELSGRIKRRWGRLSDAEIAHAEGDREYLVSKVHERYGLARDEIDEELELLGVDPPEMAVGELGSDGCADADSVVPRGSALDDQGEAAGYEQSRDNRDVAPGGDLRIDSERNAELSHEVGSDPGTGAADKDQDREAGSVSRPDRMDQQDVLKDSGAATQSGRSAPLDRPERRQGQRRQDRERRA